MSLPCFEVFLITIDSEGEIPFLIFICALSTGLRAFITKFLTENVNIRIKRNNAAEYKLVKDTRKLGNYFQRTAFSNPGF